MKKIILNLLALATKKPDMTLSYLGKVFALAEQWVKLVEEADHTLTGSAKRDKVYAQIEEILKNNGERVVPNILNMTIELAVLFMK